MTRDLPWGDDAEGEGRTEIPGGVCPEGAAEAPRSDDPAGALLLFLLLDPELPAAVVLLRMVVGRAGDAPRADAVVDGLGEGAVLDDAAAAYGRAGARDPSLGEAAVKLSLLYARGQNIALALIADFLLLPGLCEWLETTDELDALLTPPGGFKCWPRILAVSAARTSPLCRI